MKVNNVQFFPFNFKIISQVPLGLIKLKMFRWFTPSHFSVIFNKPHLGINDRG